MYLPLVTSSLIDADFRNSASECTDVCSAQGSLFQAMLRRDDRTRSQAAVADKADRTAYVALINHHLDNKSLQCS